MRRTSFALLLIVGLAGSLLGAGPASAGTYEVLACDAAPGGGAGAWTPSTQHEHLKAELRCPTRDGGDGLVTRSDGDGGEIDNIAAVRWSFKAPEGTKLLRLEATLRGNRNNTNNWGIGVGTPDQGEGRYRYGADVGEGGSDEQIGDGRGDTPNVIGLGGEPEVWIETRCGRPANCDNSNTSASLRMYSAKVTVEDETAPVLTVKGGSLVAGRTSTGEVDVSLEARDSSGLRRLELLDVTDPAAVQVVAAEDYVNQGTDSGARCDYTRASPCPQLEEDRITATPTPGMRRLSVRVIDTAGNARTSEAYSVAVDGPNGSGAGPDARLSARFAMNGRTRLTKGYGSRATVRVRLTRSGGGPIGGAVLQILSRELRQGQSTRLQRTVVTDGDGRVALRLPPGPSRLDRIEYRYRPNDARPAARAEVKFRIRAAATLSARPARARPGGLVRLSGRLVGRPLPKAGKLLDLQAYDRGRWRTFGTTRSRRGGRFKLAYRFSSRARGSFPIRARIRPDASYAYSLGYSRRVRVRVG